jgi:hypothetical protein
LYCCHHRVEHALETAGTSVAPPERTARSGTDSVLPPKPTISSSRVRVDREPARNDVGGEEGDEDGDGHKAEEKGKGIDRDGDDSDEDGDEWEGEGESGNEDEDEDMSEGKDAPVMRFGPPKVAKSHSGSGPVKSSARRDHQDATDATLASSIDSNILFFVTVYSFIYF